MAIWNVYDTKIIADVVGQVDAEGNEKEPKKPKDMSVANYVRI